MIEEALVWMLTHDSGVVAINGARVYPMRLPIDPTFPAITYQRITGDRVRSHSGPSGLASPLFQINCWGGPTSVASAYLAAKRLARAVRIALDGFKGSANGQEIHGLFVEDDRDDQDPERGIERVIIQAQIWGEEAVSL